MTDAALPGRPAALRVGPARGRLALRGEAGFVLLLACTVALLSLLPLGRLALTAVAPGGAVDLDRIVEVASRPATLRATWRTLDVAFFGMLGALALGAPFALALGLTDVPARRWLGLGILLPLMIAPQVTALAWLSAFGPASPLLNTLGIAPPPGSPNPLIGRGGIVLLFAVQHAPLVFVTLRAGLAAVPRDLVEAARAAGAPPLRVLASVVLPLLRPYALAAAALAFVAGVGNFGIPALLGIPVNYLTLPTLIYQRLASSGPGVIGEVAILSMIVALIAGAGVVAQSLALGGRTALQGGPAASFSLGRWRGAVAAALGLVVAVTMVVPFLAVTAAALVPTYGVPLTPATVTLDNFAEVLFRQASTSRAFRNSFLLAAGAAVILALLAVPVARTLDRLPRRAARLAEGLAELPYALPGIVIAIAAILLFLRPLPVLGVSLYGTVWIILAAYLMRFLPLMLKPVMAAVSQIPRDREEAAAVSGARVARRVATVVAPSAFPAVVAGALLVFMSAFNELTVSALLWSAGSETLGVALFNYEEGGYGTLAAAIAVATLAVVVAVLLALDRLGRRLPPGTLPWR